MRRVAVVGVRAGALLSVSHEGPAETRPAATRAFWAPLDALVSSERGRG